MSNFTFVPVVDAEEQPLAPCHPTRARLLLKSGRAKPYRRWDVFAIQLSNKVIPPEEVHQSTLAIDPGADHTGMAVFRQNPNTSKRTALLALTLHHRGKQIKRRMKQRKDYRRRRRSHLRYRAPRFNNRTKPEGWLAPSVKSRLDNTLTWISRLSRLVAINQVMVEAMIFDAHKLLNPEVKGAAYQQGPLYQTTLRAFIYHRDNHECRYCSLEPTKDNPLTLDHVVPISAMGPNRPDNIVAAYRTCNLAKSNTPVDTFLAGQPEKLKALQAQLKKPLASAAHANIIMAQLLKNLEAQGRPVIQTSAADTAANRQTLDIPKTHSNDAAVLGELTTLTNLPPAIEFLAQGHGQRQRCMPNKFGAPKGKAWPRYCRARDKGRPLPALPPSHKQRQIRFPDANGISTGDYVRITNKNGTFTGYAMLHLRGKGIVLSGGHKPAITARTKNAQLLRRSHGYYRIATPAVS